jgi:putative membrane protein
MIKNILKGAVIGLANIIPGVSGGTMAVSMGIYDKLIHCVTHIFKEFKKSVKFLLPIFIGAGIALVGLSFLIEGAFEHFPAQTNLLFIGLIVGGLPSIINKVKGNSIKLVHIIACLVFFVLVVGLATIGEGDGASADLTVNFINIIKFFAVGVIASATMVIPGVSGSMILMLMGYYYAIIETINTLIKALIAFDMPVLMQCMGVLVPMGIGIVVGILGIAKVVEIVFEKAPLIAYWAIIGLIVASPIAILLMGNMGSITIVTVLTSVVTFVIGFIVARLLGE